MKLVALSGYARSGKDTAALAFLDHGFTRIAFADKMRAVLLATNPYVLSLSGSPRRLRDVIVGTDWEPAKAGPFRADIRRLLQNLGTEGGRRHLGENVWVDATLNDLDADGKYVITDCRFPNEAEAVRAKGGSVWRVERKDHRAVNNHTSETALDGYTFDGTLWNIGTRDEFLEAVEAVAPWNHHSIVARRVTQPDSPYRCPYDGKRLVMEPATKASGETMTVHECLNCDYRFAQ